MVSDLLNNPEYGWCLYGEFGLIKELTFERNLKKIYINRLFEAGVWLPGTISPSSSNV